MAMLFGDVTYPGTLLMSQPGFSLLSRLPTKLCYSLSVQPVCLEYIVGDTLVSFVSALWSCAALAVVKV